MKGPPLFPRRLFRALAPTLFFAVCVVPGAAKPEKSKIKDLNDTVDDNRILTKFAQAVAGSDLGSFLSSRGPFILFAPTNSAFSRLPPGTLEALLEPQNKETLQRIVLFHLVNGQILTAKDLQKQKSLLSCEGHPIPVHTNRSGTQLVGKAKLLHADIHCANGVLDEIDTVLLPPGLVLPPPAPPPLISATPENEAPADTMDDDASATNSATNAPANPAPTHAIPVAPVAHGQ